MSEGFVLIETIGDDDHWWRYLLECRCCGQRYLYDFYEAVDWVGGNDPQRVMIVPISDDTELVALRSASRDDLEKRRPLLVKDWPADKPESEIFWVD